jgi:hypothetical protein
VIERIAVAKARLVWLSYSGVTWLFVSAREWKDRR